MTIHRSYGEVEFHCDSCPEILETETKDFQAALKVFKNSDWITRKIENDFHHVCPDCLEAESPSL